MPGSDPLWYCHECGAEMRPIVTSPEPLCASCSSSFIEQLPESDTVQPDDPRSFNAMNRLFANMGRDQDRDPDDRGPPVIGAAIDPIAHLLGAVLGMRTPGSGPSTPGPPGSAPDRPTINIRRDSDGSGSGRSRSGGGMSFQFRSGSGSSSGGSGFGMFGGFGRREEERRDPPGLEELLASMMQGMPGPPNAGQGQGPGQGPGQRGSPLLQNMLMGLFGAGIGHPGVGMGASGDGRWGDYVLNQEALDQIITQLMEGNHAAPVPVPEDMLSAWPRTILTPGNPLENEDCAICKESFAFIPPSPNTSTGTEQPKPPGDDAQPQEALTLPCKHSFHVECIEPWVKVKGTCPVCRFELVPQDRRQEGNNNNPGGSGGGGSGGSGGSGEGGSSGDSGRENRRPERRRTDRERNSPMPPGAYTQFD